MDTTISGCPDIGNGTRNLTYTINPPALRRSDASGEFPVYNPATIGIVDELHRLSAGETLVLPVGATPALARHAAPTVYRPTQQEDRPEGYQARHRAANPPWAWVLIGAGTVLAAQAVAFALTAIVAGVVQ